MLAEGVREQLTESEEAALAPGDQGHRHLRIGELGEHLAAHPARGRGLVAHRDGDGHQAPLAQATSAVATNGAGPPDTMEPSSRAKAKPEYRRVGANSSAKYAACGPNIAAITIALASTKATAIQIHSRVPTSQKNGNARAMPLSAPNR